jgi:hypothetical protein
VALAGVQATGAALRVVCIILDAACAAADRWATHWGELPPHASSPIYYSHHCTTLCHAFGMRRFSSMRALRFAHLSYIAAAQACWSGLLATLWACSHIRLPARPRMPPYHRTALWSPSLALAAPCEARASCASMNPDVYPSHAYVLNFVHNHPCLQRTANPRPGLGACAV